MSCRPRERSARTRRKRRHMFSYCNMIYEEHPPSFCYRLHSLRRFIKRRDKVIITSNGPPPSSACGARRRHHITPHQSLRPALLPCVLTPTTRASLIPCLPPPSVDCHMVCLCSCLRHFHLPFHPIVILGCVTREAVEWDRLLPTQRSLLSTYLIPSTGPAQQYHERIRPHNEQPLSLL